MRTTAFLHPANLPQVTETHQENSVFFCTIVLGCVVAPNKPEAATPEVKPRSIMFLSLSLYTEEYRKDKPNEEKWTDGANSAWGFIINAKTQELLDKGVIKDPSQLMYRHAFNEKEAQAAVLEGYERGALMLINSHGWTTDPTEDSKSFWNNQNQSATAFKTRMNRLLGEDYLTSSTKWYSCDYSHGTRTPREIYEEELNTLIDDYLRGL